MESSRQKPVFSVQIRHTWTRQTFDILFLGTVLYRNHMVPERQGSAAHEIQKIIGSPLHYLFLGQKYWMPISMNLYPTYHRTRLICPTTQVRFKIDYGSYGMTCYQITYTSGIVRTKKLSLKLNSHVTSWYPSAKSL